MRRRMRPFLSVVVENSDPSLKMGAAEAGQPVTEDAEFAGNAQTPGESLGLLGRSVAVSATVCSIRFVPASHLTMGGPAGSVSVGGVPGPQARNLPRKSEA